MVRCRCSSSAAERGQQPGARADCSAGHGQARRTAKPACVRSRGSVARSSARPCTRCCVPHGVHRTAAPPQPHLCSAAEMLSTVTEVKGVASPSLPMHAATCEREGATGGHTRGSAGGTRPGLGHAASVSCHPGGACAAACTLPAPTDGVHAAAARPHLAHQRLHHVADGHAGGDGVRVDDEVGADALSREGHVLLRRCGVGWGRRVGGWA